MSLTFSSAGSLNGSIPITGVTGETQDISEYLDFGFYDKVWYKDNAGLAPAQAGRWLGIARSTGRLMCYRILTSKGTVVSQTSVQRVTSLEAQLLENKEMFVKFDVEIHCWLKSKARGYEGAKPKPEDWADLLEEDPAFAEEFNCCFNSLDIPEQDEYTPEVLEDTYVDMEIALPRDSNGPEFARVTKRLRDNHGLPIGIASPNAMLHHKPYSTTSVVDVVH